MGNYDELREDLKGLYERMNRTDAQMSALTARLEASMAQNEKLITILRRALNYLFAVVLILLGTLVYGALGKEGFFAVRQGITGKDPQPISADNGARDLRWFLRSIPPQAEA